MERENRVLRRQLLRTELENKVLKNEYCKTQSFENFKNVIKKREYTYQGFNKDFKNKPNYLIEKNIIKLYNNHHQILIEFLEKNKDNIETLDISSPWISDTLLLKTFQKLCESGVKVKINTVIEGDRFKSNYNIFNQIDHENLTVKLTGNNKFYSHSKSMNINFKNGECINMSGSLNVSVNSRNLKEETIFTNISSLTRVNKKVYFD